MNEMRELIESAFEDKSLLREAKHKEAVFEALRLLDSGKVRVAEHTDGEWRTQQWLKKAILLYFASAEMAPIELGPFTYFDKIPLKKNLPENGVRVVPPAVARFGSFIETGAVLMPSYVNIGAYVGGGTMVDTWATVGSCAQIGKGVHLSGGVGIGGVLEPLQASPVIVEDHAFLGSRAIVVEGAIIETGAVLGANVVITASTPIVDVTGAEPKTYRGRVPARSVVIPGTTKKSFPAGEYQVPCALIIGQRKESTDQKTSLNDALRDFGVSA